MHSTPIRSWRLLLKERILKRHLLIAILVVIVMTAFHPCAYADLFICNSDGNVLRYDERTGDFLGEFVPSGSGGLSKPSGLIFGPDGNLYVGTPNGTNSILRYDGLTGAPLPSPGNT